MCFSSEGVIETGISGVSRRCDIWIPNGICLRYTEELLLLSDDKLRIDLTDEASKAMFFELFTVLEGKIQSTTKPIAYYRVLLDSVKMPIFLF